MGVAYFSTLVAKAGGGDPVARPRLQTRPAAYFTSLALALLAGALGSTASDPMEA